jgi:pimeloyl-ACP methyl ester carboxylesterase
MARRTMMRLTIALLLVAGAGVWAQRRFEARCARRSWPGALVPAPGGPLHLWCVGQGEPVVLLEPSGLGTTMQYAPVLEAIGSRTKACAWDRPGLGTSPLGTGGSTAPELGEEILGALAQQGIRGPLVVVGASASGLAALYLARCHAERVAGLVLLDALGPDGVARFAAPFARLEASTRNLAWAARLGALRVLDPFHLSEADACLTYRPSVFDATSALLRGLPESARRVNACPPLRDTMPLRVLRHGRAGDLVGPAMTPEEQQAAEPVWIELQEALAAQSTRGQLRVVEGSGHLIAAERPEAVVRAIRNVLDAIAGDAPDVQ